MNFLLIDIGYDCEELNEPLGIEVLASFIKTNYPAINVYTHCANIDGQEWNRLFDRVQPDILGISTHINTWERFNSLYSLYTLFCKNQKRSPIIIVGGILGSYEYDIILKEYKNVICSIGEGESCLSQIMYLAQNISPLTFDALIASLLEKKCSNIAVYIDNHIHCTERSCIADLSKLNNYVVHTYLPETLKNQGIARVEASRGCPWNRCSFCVLNWKYAGARWRPYSWEKVIPEIIKVAKLGAQTIYFTDEEFLAGDFLRIQKFTEQIRCLKGSGLLPPSLEFVASTSAQALLGKYGMSQTQVEECLVQLKKIGFRAFFLGIESGCDTQLKRFRKGSTVHDNENALALLNKYNIEADIGYILFDPLLTVSELSETLNFIRRNSLDCHISRFAKRLRLVPHTPYLDYEGILFESYDHNSVELLYKFRDPNIQKIYECYSSWESNHLVETHTIQAQIRASESSDKRSQKINKLERMRHTEYDVLSTLVLLSQELTDFCQKSISEISEYLLDYE